MNYIDHWRGFDPKWYEALIALFIIVIGILLFASAPEYTDAYPSYDKTFAPWRSPSFSGNGQYLGPISAQILIRCP